MISFKLAFDQTRVKKLTRVIYFLCKTTLQKLFRSGIGYVKIFSIKILLVLVQNSWHATTF